ncbi:outer membrane protein assembly factor BamD, partial [Brucella melitensis]
MEPLRSAKSTCCFKRERRYQRAGDRMTSFKFTGVTKTALLRGTIAVLI